MLEEQIAEEIQEIVEHSRVRTLLDGLDELSFDVLHLLREKPLRRCEIKTGIPRDEDGKPSNRTIDREITFLTKFGVLEQGKTRRGKREYPDYGLTPFGHELIDLLTGYEKGTVEEAVKDLVETPKDQKMLNNFKNESS